MSTFDSRAREWDKDKIHLERSAAIASEMERLIPLNTSMKALEYGAGTGILSFLLKNRFAEITLMDSSKEMIKVCEEKAEFYNTQHVKPIWFDLEHADYTKKVDIIYNQMVLHHVNNVDAIFKKFYSLLNPEGYIVIADLYPEDGSFHGTDVKVHWGFNPEKLSETLVDIGFKNCKHDTCFLMKRPNGREYPVFLLIAQK